ncbi:MAG: hypothetical protein ACFFCE_11715 [Promethearchaeota archaeon]
MLLNILLFSTIIYFLFARIKNTEIKDEDYLANDYKLNNLFLIGTSSEEFYSVSFDKPQTDFIGNLIERLLQKQEILFIVFCFNATYGLFEFLSIFKKLSKNRNSTDNITLEIEGIEVTKEEMKVFNLVQEFVNQNKVFTKEKVISYINSRFKINGNLNNNGINTTIDLLLKKNLILEGSKLTRKTVLSNTNRELVYSYIKKNPGIYANKLSKKLKLSPFVIKWHLSILLKFDLIRKQKINKNVSYFESSLSKENDKLFQIISKEKGLSIIRFLRKNKQGYNKSQIAKSLHMHYNTVTKYLNEIDKLNLLIKKRVNNTEYLYLNKSIYNSIKNKSLVIN